jgi:hypothetical protein
MAAPTLSKETLVPIGVAASVALVFVLGAFWIKDGLGVLDKRMDTEMGGIRQEMREMNARLQYADRAASDAWTTQDMELFVLRLRIDNAALNIPDPRQIHPRK